VLVDTSAWIEMLRPPSASQTAKRVKVLLTEGRAVLCEVVLLELWHGAKGKLEREALSEMQRVLTCLKIDSDVWSRSWRLAQQARQAGVTCPAVDLLIAACAFENGVEIEHNDRHLALLGKFRGR
jgi:predicted nucleic acid-binding protein